MRRVDSLEKTLTLGGIEVKGHEFEQAPGAGDGHGSLASFRPRGPKESDSTEQLNTSATVRDRECKKSRSS